MRSVEAEKKKTKTPNMVSQAVFGVLSG